MSKICTVPLTVSPFSQSNLESILMVTISFLALLSTLIMLLKLLRRPGALRKTEVLKWYAISIAVEAGILLLTAPMLSTWNKGISRHALEQACDVSEMRTQGGLIFSYLEDPGYPYLGGETRYGHLLFNYDGTSVGGGVTMRDGTATLYEGDYRANIDINVQIPECPLTDGFRRFTDGICRLTDGPLSDFRQRPISQPTKSISLVTNYG